MIATEATAILPTLPVDTLTTRCEFYRQVCQLPAHIRPELQAIIVSGSKSLAAITMPAELAVRVRNYMKRQGIRLGPILFHSRSKRWTYLVRPDAPIDTATYARMFRLQVALSRTGSEIALPSPTRRHSGFRSWAQAPKDGYRPAESLVIAAIYACAAPGPRARAAATGAGRRNTQTPT